MGNDTSIICNNTGITLNASYLDIGLTNSYDVSSIPFVPPYPFTQGNAIFVNQDDIWSELINLPFNFCFFGNTYNKIVVGANGVITFDSTLAYSFCAWSFSQTIPNATGVPYRNSINGAYHDIDPSVGGSISYDTLGIYPCRTFVVNFNNVPHYLCNNITTTQQIVLYETTNIIEVYIKDKPSCDTWNSGNAVIGIQNNSGNIGYTPTNRNTSSWVTNNEAWMFKPNDSSVTYVEWFDNSGLLIGLGDSLTVYPNTTTNYTSTITYSLCDGSQITESDQITINIDSVSNIIANSTDTNICIGQLITLTGSGALNYTWDNGVINGVAFSPLITTTYTVTGVDTNGCSNTDQITIIVNDTSYSSINYVTCIPFTWNGNIYNTSGSYTFNTLNYNGCDSIATLNLTINAITTSLNSINACDSYFWNGNTYNSSGSYTFTTSNFNGCDSIAILNLNIDSITTSLNSITACDSYIWNGNKYNLSGNYIFTTSNSSGCDSIANLDLSVIEVNIFIPNTFTPNKDLINEEFVIKLNDLIDYKLWIFNRWGEEIFYSNNSNNSWDGTFKGLICQDGVYLWKINYLCGNKINEKTGIVKLLK